jgi:hypothetical protein
VRVEELGAGEQLGEVFPDDVFEEGERVRTARDAIGQAHEARQHRRDLDARKLRAAVVLDGHGEVLAFV